MSGEIYDFTEPFSFSNLELGAPVKKGSGFTIRFSINDNPIYLQPPKCYLKSGIADSSSNKSTYCDLLFGMENEKFISWAEQLERSVCGQIYQRRENWFDSPESENISVEDIQSYLQPVGKSYKSGRMYLVRTSYVPAELHVWDEQEREVRHENVTADTRVVVILELKQLNCSSTSFQFVFELKQMMLSPERSFNRCLIKKSANPDAETPTKTFPAGHALSNSHVAEPLRPDLKATDALPKVTPPFVGDLPKAADALPKAADALPKAADPLPKAADPLPKAADAYPKAEPAVAKKKLVEEDVEFNLDELDGVETIALADPNEVYFKMYKEARRKMKEAKIIALSNYLEAKRIKTTYLADLQIEDTDDSGDEHKNKENETFLADEL